MPSPEPANLDHIAEQLRPLALPVASLVLDPENARAHPERNRAAILASLREYGQRKPIVVRREGMVVTAGNGTLDAARALGWSHLAAVVVDDDAARATGFAVADNRTAELAIWDWEQLAASLRGLEGDPVVGELWTPEELATIASVVPAFGPATGEDQADIDKLSPTPCPHCGKDTREPPAR